jgi:hypothetical protein
MDENLCSNRVFQEYGLLVVQACQRAQSGRRRQGRGRQAIVPDWALASMITLAIAAKRKSKAAQYRFCRAHAAELLALGVPAVPCRSTYYARYRQVWILIQSGIRKTGKRAIARGWAAAEQVATDKSLVAAQGPAVSKFPRSARQLRGADREAGWGKSEYDGWVYGYAYEVVVSAGASQSAVWPLLASVGKANQHEVQMFRGKIAQLPTVTRDVLADRGYDSDDLNESLEWTSDGRRSGRRFVCPLIRRANARKTPVRAWKRSRRRRLRQDHRRQRAAFLDSPRGKRLYSRRGKTSEPFNSWFKERYELQDHVWHRGLHNNQTQILAAILGYQLLLTFNCRHKRYNAQVAWILDAL